MITNNRMTIREFEMYRMGKIIAHARKMRKMSQADVASYIGIDASTYNQYELGRRPLPAWVVRTLCQYLNLSANALFDVRTRDEESLMVSYLQNEVAMLRKMIENGFASTCNKKHWRKPVYCILPQGHPKTDHVDIGGFAWGVDGE